MPTITIRKEASPTPDLELSLVPLMSKDSPLELMVEWRTPGGGMNRNYLLTIRTDGTLCRCAGVCVPGIQTEAPNSVIKLKE
jgi:hypothetical protein